MYVYTYVDVFLMMDSLHRVKHHPNLLPEPTFSLLMNIHYLFIVSFRGNCVSGVLMLPVSIFLHD